MDLRPLPDDRSYSVEQVLAEVEAIVAEAQTLLLDVDLTTATMVAEERAAERDRTRPTRGPLFLAEMLVTWLVSRVEGLGEAEKMEKVVAAAHQDPTEPLSQELLALIVGYLAGEITDEQLADLTGGKGSPVSPAPPSHPSLAPPMLVSDAERVLRSRIDESGANPVAAWEAFKTFARLPLRAEAPLGVDADDFLFEAGIEEGEVFVDFVRQVALADLTGANRRMEQFYCRFRWSAPDDPTHFARGPLWAGDDLEGWFSEVEMHPAFRMLLVSVDPTGPEVGREQV